MENPNIILEHERLPYEERFTPEYQKLITRNKQNNAYYQIIKYNDVHKKTNGWFPHISRGMGEVIGEYDVNNDHKLIPNIRPTTNPFTKFEGNWDLHDLDDYSKLKDINLWKPDKRFKPVRSWFYKHQNPVIGVLGRDLRSTSKRAALFCSNPMNLALVSKLKACSHDMDKIWRIEGMAVPVGYQSTDGYWRDYSSTVAFPHEFSFGKRLTRTYYAIYNTKKEMFMYTPTDIRTRERLGTKFHNNPVFVDTSVVKWAQRFIATGFDKDEYYNDCIVVRYHFHPLISFPYSRYNGMKKQTVLKEYADGNKDVINYSYYAFEHHHKQLAKLRKKY